jgi:hypothetical protein
MRKYSFLWVTGALFLITLIGHWVFGWFAFVSEQAEHMQPADPGEYTILMLRDTLENWQSEFLQLAWQVAGLAFLYYAGSPQSRGDDERMEAKLDAILDRLDPDSAKAIIAELDRRYPGREPGV